MAKKEFGGAAGNIDYGDMRDKKSSGSPAGNDLSRKGGTSKTEGITTTDTGDASGYAGTIKDTKSKSVGDQSGWGR